MIKRILTVRWKYLFHKSYVRVWPDSTMKVGKNTKIVNSKIYCLNRATLIIGKNCTIENIILYISDGVVVIDDFTMLINSNRSYKSNYILDKGNLSIGNHSKLSLKRIWIRFGGNLSIGAYTNINEDSEIRCDEDIRIGSYNQVSYGVRIWDTNTHIIYPPEQRKEIARRYYPYFGYEIGKPETLPICIGDNCWIGERSSIMKGTKLGNNVVVGYNTMILNKTIESDKKVVSNIELRIL